MRIAMARTWARSVAVTALAALTALLLTLLGPVGAARADTGPFQARRVYVNLWHRRASGCVTATRISCRASGTPRAMRARPK